MHVYGIEEHLAKTWLMLVGEQLSFVAQTITAEELHAQHYFVVTLHPTPKGHLAGVGLAIAEDDARNLASHMFELAIAELNAADVADACGELSNIFAGGVPGHVDSDLVLDLGLPARLTAEQFLSVLASSTISGSYITQQREHHIQVIIFETLQLPPAIGWSPVP
jgi:CheY-specific phosphatase CheX